MPSLLVSINPRSRDGEVFPNIAQSGADGALGSSSGATLSVGTHACVTHTVRESAQCLGGVQLLFPLLARLPGASASPGTNSELVTTPGQLLVQLLGLVCQMLASSTHDRHFMLRRHGFAIFVFLLRQLPPILWTVEAVSACVSITSCFAGTEALHHEAVWLLFGVPRLWVYTSVSVQLGVYDVLQLVIERKPQESGGPTAAHTTMLARLECSPFSCVKAFLSPGVSGEPLISIQAFAILLASYECVVASI